MVGWSLYEDLKFGKINEKKLCYYLNKDKYKNDFLKMYKNEKNQVDFKNNSEISELKARQNEYSRYPTTFFGYNKLQHIDKLKNTKNRIFKFYFLFTDGLYEWTYNKDSKYTIQDDYFHKERGRDIKMVHVDINDLTLLTKDLTSRCPLPSDYLSYL